MIPLPWTQHRQPKLNSYALRPHCPTWTEPNRRSTTAESAMHARHPIAEPCSQYHPLPNTLPDLSQRINAHFQLGLAIPAIHQDIDVAKIRPIYRNSLKEEGAGSIAKRNLAPAKRAIQTVGARSTIQPAGTSPASPAPPLSRQHLAQSLPDSSPVPLLQAPPTGQVRPVNRAGYGQVSEKPVLSRGMDRTVSKRRSVRSSVVSSLPSPGVARCRLASSHQPARRPPPRGVASGPRNPA
jgi:hypothetical protein